LLNRIPAKHVKHDLAAAIDLIQASDKVHLEITPNTRSFIEHLDMFGRFRYLEVSNVAFGGNLISLDRAA